MTRAFQLDDFEAIQRQKEELLRKYTDEQIKVLIAVFLRHKSRHPAEYQEPSLTLRYLARLLELPYSRLHRLIQHYLEFQSFKNNQRDEQRNRRFEILETLNSNDPAGTLQK